MNATQKDIIYIDIDDEITGIIEKVRGAEHRIVALVLPKRAAVLQSVVNMKLLKRSGDEAKKHIVLITSEAGLIPLAGAVGLHVAKTLQSKPAIPAAPKVHDGNAIVDEADNIEDTDEELDASKPIGVLAGVGIGKKDADNDEETIEVDNTDEAEPEELHDPVKPNKKLKVPDFHKFRTRLFLGGAGLVLILVLWYLAAFSLPKAKITIKTDTTSVTSELVFTTNRDIKTVDAEKKILPATVEKVKQQDSEKATATGEKDNGAKASGSVQMGANNCTNLNTPASVPSGTTLTSGGVSYVTQGTVTFEFDDINGSCIHYTSQGPVTIVAKEGGEKANTKSTATFTVSGRSDVTATGSASGGTTKIVKVVSQKDYDDALKKITDRAQSGAEEGLLKALEAKGLYALKETIVTAEPEIKVSPAVNEEATEFTVSSSITYTMIGVKKEDLTKLIQDNVKDKYDSAKQIVQNVGLDQAVARVTDKQSNGKSSVTLQSIVVIGPNLDLEAIKKEIAGKKRGDTQDLLSDRPGVREVTVDYSPFWVHSTPGKTGKISITLEQ